MLDLYCKIMGIITISVMLLGMAYTFYEEDKGEGLFTQFSICLMVLMTVYIDILLIFA